jgi:hypothetical protein
MGWVAALPSIAVIPERSLFMTFRRVSLFTAIPAFLFGALPIWAETLPSGTKLVVQLQQEIQPDSKNAEQFTAAVVYPVFANEREVVPAGSKVEGEVRGTKKEVFLSPRLLILPDGREVDFTATVSKIDNRNLQAEQKEGTIAERGDKGEATQQAGQMGVTGAGIGAMTTGTATGAAIGAAAGVAAVLIGRRIAGSRHATVIPAGTQLTLNLTQALEIPDARAETNSPASVGRLSGRDDRRPSLRRPETD